MYIARLAALDPRFRRPSPKACYASPMTARSLREVIAERATEDGAGGAGESGVHFYPASAPGPFRKTNVSEPRLIVGPQGRQGAKFPDGGFRYDEHHYR